MGNHAGQPVTGVHNLLMGSPLCLRSESGQKGQGRYAPTTRSQRKDLADPI